jgi:hypothetical protein
MNPQIEIKQGISKSFTLDVSEYPQTEAHWKAALVNPSMNMRYESETPVEKDGNVTFTWLSGLNSGEEDKDNTTIKMSVGTYDLEIYLDDHSDMGTLYGGVRVVKSNLVAKNV